MKNYKKDDRLKDFAYFCNNSRSLLEEYGNSYIAIREEAVLGSFPSIDEAIKGLYPEHEPGTYILQECNEREILEIEKAAKRRR